MQVIVDFSDAFLILLILLLIDIDTKMKEIHILLQ